MEKLGAFIWATFEAPCYKLNCISPALVASWGHASEETQERILQSDTRLGHERNGGASHVSFRPEEGAHQSATRALPKRLKARL
jgi:hypothetical protein